MFHVVAGRSAVSPLVRRWAGRAVSAAAALLFGFHLALFAERLATGGLLDPLAAGRWLAGAGLLATLVLMRRSGVPIWWGRRAAVLWALIFFLHWNVGHPGVHTTEAGEAGMKTAFVLVVLPSAGAAAVALAAALLGLLATSARQWSRRPIAHPAEVAVASSVGTRDGHFLALWTRPPPRR